jgi:hypothetical protein
MDFLHGMELEMQVLLAYVAMVGIHLEELDKLVVGVNILE